MEKEDNKELCESNRNYFHTALITMQSTSAYIIFENVIDAHMGVSFITDVEM